MIAPFSVVVSDSVQPRKNINEEINKVVVSGVFIPPLQVRHPKPSITAGLISRSLLRKEPFPDLLESVITECFYRESRRDRNWTPD
jgi:hypothetical protein